MKVSSRRAVKRALGALPWTAEAYQWIQAPDRPAIPGYDLERLASALPAWTEAALKARRTNGREQPSRRVLVIGALPWWLDYATALSLLLAADGLQVDLGFFPYQTWTEELDPFDARRQAAYMRRRLAVARPVLGLLDLSAIAPRRLAPGLQEQIEEQSRIDTQYTLQREAIDIEGSDRELYRLRLGRNAAAAIAARRILTSRRYEAVIVPNGSILEFGTVYRVARFLGVPVVTYEFGEQRERMWLAQDQEVMRQDTSAMWQVRGSQPLTENEVRALEVMLQARRGGRRWANFGRQWQASPSQGVDATRRLLKVDANKPIALLCTNVVGDSLALGRQVFTDGMADWLARMVRYFAAHTEAQLIVRVHPGELLGAGHPSVEIVRSELSQLPAHVIVIPPESKVNTYDLIDLARVGLVYTTTVGLEMAMAGVPVIVAGQTHYRGRGFTTDPCTMEECLGAVDRVLDEGQIGASRDDRVELAWRYAYRYFFEYPFPFPWHLIGFWQDIATRPFNMIATRAGMAPYRRTLAALSGRPIEWGTVAA